MRIKPKILASNPPSIAMPATGLYQREKREIDFDNKAIECILLTGRRLRRSKLASFCERLPHNRLAVANSGRKSRFRQDLQRQYENNFILGVF
jgi:hypothetical protein